MVDFSIPCPDFGSLERAKEGNGGKNFEKQDVEIAHITSSAHFLWSKFSHMAIPLCKRCWEMYI